MELYKKAGDITFNICNISDMPNSLTTTGKTDLYKPMQIEGQTGIAVERYQIINLRALKATNKNAEK